MQNFNDNESDPNEKTYILETTIIDSGIGID